MTEQIQTHVSIVFKGLRDNQTLLVYWTDRLSWNGRLRRIIVPPGVIQREVIRRRIEILPPTSSDILLNDKYTPLSLKVSASREPRDWSPIISSLW